MVLHVRLMCIRDVLKQKIAEGCKIFVTIEMLKHVLARRLAKCTQSVLRVLN